MAWGAIAGGLLGLAGAKMGADATGKAASQAAEAQLEAARIADERIREFQAQADARLNPYNQAGLGALGVPTNALAQAAGGATMTGSASAAPAMMDPRETMPKMAAIDPGNKPKRVGGHRRGRGNWQQKKKQAAATKAWQAKKDAYDEAVAWNKKRDAAIKKYDRWAKKQKESAPPASGTNMVAGQPTTKTQAPAVQQATQAEMAARAPAGTYTPTQEFVNATPAERQMLMDGGLIGTYAAPNPVPQFDFNPTAGQQTNLMALAPQQQVGGGLMGQLPQWNMPQGVRV